MQNRSSLTFLSPHYFLFQFFYWDGIYVCVVEKRLPDESRINPCTGVGPLPLKSQNYGNNLQYHLIYLERVCLWMFPQRNTNNLLQGCANILDILSFHVYTIHTNQAWSSVLLYFKPRPFPVYFRKRFFVLGELEAGCWEVLCAVRKEDAGSPVVD